MKHPVHPALSLRQSEILITYGRTGSQALAAHELGISEQTVKNHLTAIYQALKVNGGVQALYKLFGGEVLLEERRELMRDQLTKYLKAEWLDDALKRAAHAATESMVRSIDHRLYVEKRAEEDETGRWGPHGRWSAKRKPPVTMERR